MSTRPKPKAKGAMLLDGQAFLNQSRELMAQFALAHADGMNAIRSEDSAGFADAIDRERAIIHEHRALLESRVKHPGPKSRK